jgi:hypothetical protein
LMGLIKINGASEEVVKNWSISTYRQGYFKNSSAAKCINELLNLIVSEAFEVNILVNFSFYLVHNFYLSMYNLSQKLDVRNFRS